MIRQFDVAPTPAGGQGAELLVVLQSHLLPGLDTVLVAPLIERDRLAADGAVFIAVDILGRAYTLNLTQIASVQQRRLSRTVGSLAAHEDDIRRGLERLFTGF